LLHRLGELLRRNSRRRFHLSLLACGNGAVNTYASSLPKPRRSRQRKLSRTQWSTLSGAVLWDEDWWDGKQWCLDEDGEHWSLDEDDSMDSAIAPEAQDFPWRGLALS